MEVERLKVIAEGMGHISLSIWDSKVWTRDKEEIIRPVEYDPENNPAQLLEIIEYLLSLNYLIFKNDKKYAVTQIGDLYKSEKTLSEAVLQAAYEVFKVNNDKGKGNQ